MTVAREGGRSSWLRLTVGVKLVFGSNKPSTNKFSDGYCPCANNPVHSPYPEEWSCPLITCNTSYWTPCNKVADRTCMGDGLPGGGPESREKGKFGPGVVDAEAEVV